MRGYWSTASRGSVIAPSSVMITDTAHAKIGRSMKKCASFMASASPRVATAPAAALLRRRGQSPA